MIIERIKYSKNFIKQLKTLPDSIITAAISKENIFRVNPLHPSLRLHQLHGKLTGLWSISVSSNYRIIFKRQANGDIAFISIGRHDIYSHL
jgi:addiction module RelE/StbE family toxin